MMPGLGRVGRRVAGWRRRATDLPGVLPGSGIWRRRAGPRLRRLPSLPGRSRASLWRRPHLSRVRCGPYQVEGFRWLARLASLGFGGILADEMGLGKTLQMIALVKSLRDSGQLGGPVLVACPASLVFNWADEFARFALDVPVCALEGSRAHREVLLFRATQGIDEGRVLGCGDDAGEDARTAGERIAGASTPMSRA